MAHHIRASRTLTKLVGVFKGVTTRFFACLVIFALGILPVAPALASEEIQETIQIDETPIEVATPPDEPIEIIEEVEVIEEDENDIEEVVDESINDSGEPNEETEESSESVGETLLDSNEATSTPEEETSEPESGTTTEPLLEPSQGAATTTEESPIPTVIDDLANVNASGTVPIDDGTEEPLDDGDVGTTSDKVDESTAPATTTSTTSTTTSDVPPQGNEQQQNEPQEDTGDIKEKKQESVDTVTEKVSEPEEVATTTTGDALTPKPEHVTAVVFNDENKFTFSKDECVGVGDGMFYCADGSEEGSVSEESAVFSESDSNGDREIFLRSGGKVTQITDNLTDDDAPYYDELSETIVWHRLLNGRYQIFEYDLNTKEERQLTTERYNNMQPSRYGDIIVWQGWVGNDWEVMLEEKGELLMLTDNDIHDISPRINGDHIIWQSFENNVWRVKVYDTISGETRTISDSEGGSIENPRFVLVYDTKFDNGDVETRGYDLESGELVPLSSSPGPLPKDLPDPDPTDEDRAMVQTITQLKPKSESDSDDDIEPNPVGGGNTATSSTDVVIPPYDDGLITASTTETVSTPEDMVIPPVLETPKTDTSTTTPAVEDLMVTPFVESTTTIHSLTEDVATTTESMEAID